jgi:GNAT superfamily N-acetyltransferase
MKHNPRVAGGRRATSSIKEKPVEQEQGFADPFPTAKLTVGGHFPNTGAHDVLQSASTVFSVTEASYWKVPFEWTGKAAPAEDELHDRSCWLTGKDAPPPVELVADVLANSPGPEDRHAVERLGPEEAARRLLALAAGFSYLPERWHVLKVDEHTAAGFVLPVVYDDSRGGLDEATIYHMGVAPNHRGAGIGRLLLRRATRVLLSHGVWRIFCDTAATNEPMIHLFEQEGWIRLPPYERPIPPL